MADRMTLGQFLGIVGSEYIRIAEGNIYNVIYEADKNAIRANKTELLGREVYIVHPAGKNKFEVLIY